jgi:hypothetical protein
MPGTWPTRSPSPVVSRSRSHGSREYHQEAGAKGYLHRDILVPAHVVEHRHHDRNHDESATHAQEPLAQANNNARGHQNDDQA